MTSRYTTKRFLIRRLLDGFMQTGRDGCGGLLRFCRWIGHLRYGMDYSYSHGLKYAGEFKVTLGAFCSVFSPSILCYCAWNFGRLRRYSHGFVYSRLGAFWLAVLSLICLGLLYFTLPSSTMGLGAILRKSNLIYLISLFLIYGI